MAHKRNGSTRTQAAQADKYALYQKAVQEPDNEVRFFDRVYRKAYGTSPQVLREDFCGTFAICCRWAASRADRRSIGVDLDPQPLAWGRRHNLAKLTPEQQQRVQLLQDDVRTVCPRKADVLAAQNFSFWIFKTRDELRRYFSTARRNLAQQGVIILDMMGGSEVHEEDHVDSRSIGGCKYLWEQARLDPITHNARYHIHFAFKDGSRLERAFTYDWRLWTLPEVQELLLEAGFTHADVYWEDTDSDTGDGNGNYRKRRSASSDPAWIAYVVGVK